ncbi:MAG: hypothetical protein ACRD1R_17605, partial [Acidobacteriota bacterium]
MISVFNFLLNEMWPGLALIWICFHVPIGILIYGLAWLVWRRRLKWHRLDAVALFVPYFLWASLLIV